MHGQALWEALAQGWVDEAIWEQLIDEVEAQGFVQSQLLWWEAQRPRQVPGPPLCGGCTLRTQEGVLAPPPRPSDDCILRSLDLGGTLEVTWSEPHSERCKLSDIR